MIIFDHLKVVYKDVTALDIRETVRFDKPVNRIGVIGSNGAGKTTLIKTVLGLVPYTGRVSVGCGLHEIAVHMQKNGYHDQVPVGRVMEFVLGCPPGKHARAKELILFFDFEKCLRKSFRHLSGGEKQKMTLILVLSMESRMVILDEVTSGLDFVSRQQLMELLNTWFQKENKDLMIVSHYYAEIENLADQLMILDKGKVAAWGDTEALFKRYCGNALYMVSRIQSASPEFAGELRKDFKVIDEEEDSLAVRIDDKEEEFRLLTRLHQSDLPFQKTKMSLEQLSKAVLREMGKEEDR